MNATSARTTDLVDHRFVPRNSHAHSHERVPPQPALSNSVLHALHGLLPHIASIVPGAATMHRSLHCSRMRYSHTACCSGSARGASPAGASKCWWHVATVRTGPATIVVTVMNDEGITCLLGFELVSALIVWFVRGSA